MKARLSVIAVAGAVGLSCLGPSALFAEECGLALVLALDASKSMNSGEFGLQFQGTAAALMQAEVQQAILSQGALVAISAFEWSGQSHQTLIADWRLLRSPGDIEAFAAAIARHDRVGARHRTGTGSALEFAYRQLASGPACERSVIDVSSDGYSNDGLSPKEFYAKAPAGAVTVNALVVGGKTRPVLWDWFKSDVRHGPGAFTMATYGFEDYRQAITEKLLREVTPAAFVALAH